jgi:lipopolysaccharide biosynthesis glycosyltransferase
MSGPERHDCAVAFCCDRNFFHYALFMIRQIDHYNPLRKFDFVISTQDDLEVPDWARRYGIVLHKTGALPEAAISIGRFRGSVAPMFRLLLARELGDRYRRILYLDCDIFIEGGDINRLLEVELGPHPLAAALDAPYFMTADFKPTEYIRAGLPNRLYANTGVQVIDTRAYREQDVERRAFEMAIKYPDAITLTDQSLTNLALHGGFARLAPCWNWQINHSLPLIPMRYPVFFRHFVSSRKPDRDAVGWHEARFNQAYREFMTALMPDRASKVAPLFDSAPMSFKEVAGMVYKHIMGARLVSDVITRFPDPYRALI